MRRFLLTLSALVCAAPAQAEWYRASSAHFVIYSEQKPVALRQFAENLEKFDAAVRLVRGMADLPPSEGNRVTIFSVGKPEEVQRLMGDKSGFIRGFYQGRASGSVAFVSRGNQETYEYQPTGTRRTARIEYGMGDDTLLFHEYAHHLMMQELVTPVPNWFIEGFAEFMSTAKIERDGSVGLGLPATHRYAGLLADQGLPLDQVLSDVSPKTIRDMESFYGQGWLLTHFLTFDPARKSQMETYLRALSKNVTPLDAAKQAFGDLAVLDGELRKYLQRSKLRYLTIAKEAVPIGTIDIQPLGASASAIMPLLIEVSNRVDSAQAGSLVAKAREVQKRFPADPLVETTLAQLELEAKNPAAAADAANRVLAANPKHLDATVLLGRALAAQADALEGDARHAMFERARKALSSANAIDNEDPEPMMEYYYSYLKEGRPPNANAIAALHYASELAPQDSGLRMNSAMHYLADGKLADARRALIRIAFDPHGGGYSNYARKIFMAIEAGDKDRALELAQSEPSQD